MGCRNKCTESIVVIQDPSNSPAVRISCSHRQRSSSESSPPSNSIANNSLLLFISSLSTFGAFPGVSSYGRRILRGLRALSGVKGILEVFGRRGWSGDANETLCNRSDSSVRHLVLGYIFSLSSCEFSLSSSESCESFEEEWLDREEGLGSQSIQTSKPGWWVFFRGFDDDGIENGRDKDATGTCNDE